MATNTTERPSTVVSGNGAGQPDTLRETMDIGREAAEPVRRESESTSTLLGRLFDEVTTLIRKELALARSEMTESISGARSGIAGVASGGAVLYAGFLMLLLAAVIGLAQVMEAWLSALIVGAVVAIVGFIMLQAGRRKLRPESLTPGRTRDALLKDKEALQRRSRQ